MDLLFDGDGGSSLRTGRGCGGARCGIGTLPSCEVNLQLPQAEVRREDQLSSHCQELWRSHLSEGCEQHCKLSPFL